MASLRRAMTTPSAKRLKSSYVCQQMKGACGGGLRIARCSDANHQNWLTRERSRKEIACHARAAYSPCGMAQPIPILVTGSSGRIGRAVVAELQQRGHIVRGFDRTPSPDLDDCINGDLTDRDIIDGAMRGIDCLVHLAATPDDADFLTELLPNNLVGLFHVMESARAAGVKRIVLASSGQVNWWQQQRGPFPVHPDDPPSPRSWYAATKIFAEAIGHGFAESGNISVIVARLGWCPRTLDQVAEIHADDWAKDIYLSPGDAGRFIACAVEASAEIRHAVVHATSRPFAQTRLDLSPAAKLLGYEPQETWPQGIEVVRS